MRLRHERRRLRSCRRRRGGSSLSSSARVGSGRWDCAKLRSSRAPVPRARTPERLAAGSPVGPGPAACGVMSLGFCLRVIPGPWSEGSPERMGDMSSTKTPAGSIDSTSPVACAPATRDPGEPSKSIHSHVRAALARGGSVEQIEAAADAARASQVEGSPVLACSQASKRPRQAATSGGSRSHRLAWASSVTTPSAARSPAISRIGPRRRLRTRSARPARSAIWPRPAGRRTRASRRGPSLASPRTARAAAPTPASARVRIHVALRPVDMRAQFDGLAGAVCHRW